MSYYIRDGVDLKEVPLHKVETLMNAGITIISDKDIIKELKQQFELDFQEKMELFDVVNRIDSQLKEAVEVIERLDNVSVNPKENKISLELYRGEVRQFLAKYRGGRDEMP